MYPDLLVSIVYHPSLILLNVYVPVSLVTSFMRIVPLVTLIPLLILRETPGTGLLLTASLIVPEIVPELQLSGSIFRVEATTVWLSVVRVIDWVSSR